MATGTGKTITALICAQDFLRTNKSTVVIIVCPYQHLVDQWQNELMRFGYYAVCCYRNKESWYNRVIEKIRDVNLGVTDNAFIISTSTTASMDAFQEVIKRIRKNVLLIADEAHNLGAEKRQIILNKTFKGRIGLSATPQRWFDESGTDKLCKYFDKVVFRYDMKEAIENGVLTKYEYNPIIIELDKEEYEKYEELSQKINKLILAGVTEDDEGLSLLLIKRANIINDAKDKLEKFKSLIKNDGDLKYTLVYTSPGQIKAVQDILNENNVFYQRFTSRESNSERKRILEQFKCGDVGVLVAMHCLDEGVDVPATRKAYILASSANPKEFIQRRGRVLRKSPGKDKAIIYDFIAVPPKGAEVSSATQSIIRKELRRFKEFADLAINEFSAKLKISEIAKLYNVLDEV